MKLIEKYLFRVVLVTLLIITGVKSLDEADQEDEEDDETTGFRRSTDINNVKEIFSRFKKETETQASYYGKYPGGGACGMDPLPPMYRQEGKLIQVAAGKDDYQQSLGCGMCVSISPTGKDIPGTTPITKNLTAVVIDLCGACVQGMFDLYIPGTGKPGTIMKAIPCPDIEGDDGKIRFRFTENNLWNMKVQVTNSRLPIASLEGLHNDKWHCMKRTQDSHFVLSGVGKFKFPMEFRITSVAGEQILLMLSAMVPQKDIVTDLQFKEDLGGTPPLLKCFGQGGLVQDNLNEENQDGGGSNATGGGNTPANGTVTPTQPTAPTTPTTGSNSNEGANAAKPVNDKWCEGEDNGIHANPSDCTGFIICDKGITYFKDCAKGLRFNPKIMNCDHAANVVCKNEASEKSEKAEKATYNQFKHYNQTTNNAIHNMSINHPAIMPKNVTMASFEEGTGAPIHPINNISYLKETEENLDDTVGALENPSPSPEQIKSGVEIETVYEGMNAKPIESHFNLTSVTQAPHNNKSNLINSSISNNANQTTNFKIVRLGNSTSQKEMEATIKNISVPLFMNHVANISTSDDITSVTQKNVTLAKDHNITFDLKQLKKTLPTAPPPNDGAMKEDGTPVHGTKLSHSAFCQGRFDGRYYHSDNCRQFYQCSRGRAYLRSCPEGLFYNAKKSVCDFPKRVNCKRHKSKHKHEEED